MNKNILIVLIGGFFIAVLVAMLVQMSLGGSKKKETEIVMQSVLVAAKNIPVGRELTADDLKWKKWPESVIFPGAIVREEGQLAGDAISGKAIRRINENEPVHMSAVVSDEGGFLSAKVGHGMRAIGITVRKHIVADRLVMPGDLVDIIVTYRVRVNARKNPEVKSLINRYASETILENVRILAIDTNTSTARGDSGDDKKKKKKSKKKVTVTLEVTPEGAEQLMLAGEMGDISFATRGIAKEPEEKDDNMTTDVHMSRVLTDLSKLTAGGSGGFGAVRIFSGNSMKEVRGRRQIEDVTEGIDFSVEERPNDVPTTILNLPPKSAIESLEE
jgi:pilus assembly protein CpaB